LRAQITCRWCRGYGQSQPKRIDVRVERLVDLRGIACISKRLAVGCESIIFILKLPALRRAITGTTARSEENEHIAW